MIMVEPFTAVLYCNDAVIQLSRERSPMTIRIKIINGNTFRAMTEEIDRIAQQVRSPQTEIVTTQPRSGPQSIESYYDEYLAIPGILEEIILSKDDYHGFILACWGDPGIEAARELTPKPVIGVAEASMYVANMLAARWGVLTTQHRTLDMVEKTIQKTGFSQRCVSIRTTGIPVVETETARAATVDALEVEARDAIAQDKVEAICLGCAGMAGLDKELEARLGIPVIDAVAAAVKLTEAVVGLKKQTSKALTYQHPTTKPFDGYPNHMIP
jgi:allantoin racemase